MQLTKASIVLLAAAAWLLIASPTSADNAATVDATGEAADKAASKTEGSRQMAARIDAVIEQTWAIEHIEPAPLAADGEFLRRAYLDLNGVIPRAAEVREFLATTTPTNESTSSIACSPRRAMRRTWPRPGATASSRPASIPHAVRRQWPCKSGCGRGSPRTFATTISWASCCSRSAATSWARRFTIRPTICRRKSWRPAPPSCSWASSCTAPSATIIRRRTGRNATSGASPRSSPA